MQTPRNGLPSEMYSSTGSTSPPERRFAIVSAAAPTPGTISAFARPTAAGSEVTSASTPA